MQFSYLAVPLSLIALAAALPSPSIEEITGEVNHFVDGLENVKITGLSKSKSSREKATNCTANNFVQGKAAI